MWSNLPHKTLGYISSILKDKSSTSVFWSMVCFVLCRKHPTNITHIRLCFYFPFVPCSIARATIQQDLHPEELLVFWLQKSQTICGQFFFKPLAPVHLFLFVSFFNSDLKKNPQSTIDKGNSYAETFT